MLVIFEQFDHLIVFHEFSSPTWIKILTPNGSIIEQFRWYWAVKSYDFVTTSSLQHIYQSGEQLNDTNFCILTVMKVLHKFPLAYSIEHHRHNLAVEMFNWAVKSYEQFYWTVTYEKKRVVIGERFSTKNWVIVIVILHSYIEQLNHTNLWRTKESKFWSHWADNSYNFVTTPSLSNIHQVSS